MIKKAIFILLVVFSTSANAVYTCTGPVTGLTIEPTSGDVIPEAAGGFSWPRMCSVSSSKNGISVESCKVIYSALLAAQTTGKTVTLWFNDNGDCSSSSHPSWQLLTGWYFGPKINN